MLKHNKVNKIGLGKKSLREKLLKPTLQTLVAGMVILAVSTIGLMYFQIDSQTRKSQKKCV